MRRTIALLVLLLAGCASTSDVISLGGNRYTVTSKMSGNMPDWPEVKALALQRANEHCADLGKQMTAGELKTHGARGWSPISVDLTYQCGEK